MSTGILNSDWLDLAADSCSLKLATVQMCHLRSLAINNQWFSLWQWSNLLRHLKGPQLEILRIRGQLSTNALSILLSQHSHIHGLHFQPCWAAHNQCIKAVECLPKILMPNLSEMEGPPCHVQAVLKHIMPTSSELTIKMGCDWPMTYPQYIRAVLGSVSQCKAPICLEICLARHFNPLQDQRKLETLCTILLPQVISLEISFHSVGESQILVRIVLLFFQFRHI
jgi:hypothetical protein